MTTYPKATAIALESSIEYAQGAIISKQVTKNSVGNITLFAFDKAQGLTEHTADYDAFVQILDGEAEIRIDGNPHQLRKRRLHHYACQSTTRSAGYREFQDVAYYDTR